MYKGYLRSLIVGKNMELMTPIFLRIRKKIIGIITVRIKMGRIFPLCSSNELYFGVTKKYNMVPPIGMKRG